MLKKFIEDKTLGFFVKTNGIFSRPFFSGIGHILCFHRVCPKQDRARIINNSGMEVTPEFLEFVISYFKGRDYQFIDLNTLYETLISGKKFNRKFVIFTLDDGFKDNYTYAYPVFKKHNIPFTIYVATSFPDRKAVLWGYMLEDLLLKENEIAFTFGKINYKYSCSTSVEKDKAFSEIRRIIIENENDKMPEILSSILRSDEKTALDYIDKNALTWEQITELSQDPLVTIGAHTINHYSLSKLPEEKAHIEIAASKEILESKLNKAVEHFAYPYGSESDYSKRESDLIKRSDYKTAVSLKQGNIFYKSRDYFNQLPRIPLGENTTLEKLNNIANGIHHFGFNGF